MKFIQKKPIKAFKHYCRLTFNLKTVNYEKNNYY